MWVQKVPGGGVTALAYAPDGRTLYTLDAGGSVTAWDTTARIGTPLFRLDPSVLMLYTRLRATPDGGFLLMPQMFEGIVWDLAAEKFGLPLPTRAGVVAGCVPDRTAPRVWFVGLGARSIDSWDVGTGLFGPTVTGCPMYPFPAGFDFHPHGHTLALTTHEPQFAVCDLVTGTHVRHDTDLVSSLPQFSPDGRALLLLGVRQVEVWDAEAWELRVPSFACHRPDRVFDFHPHAPVFVALNPDRAITLFSLETGRPIRTYDFALGKQVNCVAFAPDGLTCAAGGSNKRFVVFDVDL